jgi:hypothetical protein
MNALFREALHSSMKHKRKVVKAVKPAARGLRAADVDLVLSQNVRNIVKKAAAGKVLTSREQDLLERQRKTEGEKPAAVDARIWMTPSDAERWLKRKGIRISHKSLYETYIGTHARHAAAVSRTEDGRKLHAPKLLELIRIVQNREPVDALAALTERNAADARFAAARAALLEIRLAEARREKIDRAIVQKTIVRAVESLKNNLKTRSISLPDQMHGKPAAEIKQIIEKSDFEILKQFQNDLTVKE